MHRIHTATRAVILSLLLTLALTAGATAQGTRLLRQPTVSATHIAFAHGGDLWIAERSGGEARRLTSTPATEGDPHFSPDGRRIAFTSDRTGANVVYVVGVEGGEPTRLTWHPGSSRARGWTPDGSKVLYASVRETAPRPYYRLWTVAVEGGPSELLPAPWAVSGSYAPDGRRLVVDRMSRWDEEWRGYRGGQNTPLVILDLADLGETMIPGDRTTDTRPIWIGDTIWFLSDRSRTTNVWSFRPATGELAQRTSFTGSDVKALAGTGDLLAFERDGFLHALDAGSGQARALEITVRGDFPWAEARWEDVSDAARSASLSPTGQRVLLEARGEVFTVPVERGDARNLSRSSDAADRRPVWSPDGGSIAWFSDEGGDGYALLIGGQDGMGEPRRIDIGESKLGWEPVWSPDGSRIAFVDDEVRVRVVDVASGRVTTADVGGVNIERGGMGLTWSPDSRWLAYAKTGANNFRRIMAWSVNRGQATALTDPMADAFAPAWDRDGRHLYFLAGTDLGLGAGWANTSAMRAEPSYGAYVMVLRESDPTPFVPRSDEEPAAADSADDEGDDEKPAGDPEPVRIDLERLDRRTVALPVPVRRYTTTIAGPAGTVFLAERAPGEPGMVLHRFSVEEREAKEFAKGLQYATVSADGKKLLLRSGGAWRVVGTDRPPEPGAGTVEVSLRMRLDREAEWRQMFEEAWRYQRDYFYDPGMHGRDWDAVYARYSPLVPHIRHRSDLTYVLDQMNGELSVGHSFVFGGDFPDVDTTRVGLLGADLVAHDGGWRIDRIYQSESWNPDLTAPLDRPGLNVREGHYLVGVNGVPVTRDDDPYRLLDGTADRQTVLHINERPGMRGAWQVVVEPIRNEYALRQRAWVEDNRRRVDELSDGRLAYVWVPNTGGQGVVSFDRYFFAQQHKQGAVIDERFNGGGLLDDYMVDLMTRRLRAAITNEAPGGTHFRLPAGILGPKVLLIN
ncbi:MAG: PDZ domain-containing protein, partial [Gemmatimonadetes bacterium]|nr:PDZ domain-containing protein [Gemmatimonadota bacterium]